MSDNPERSLEEISRHLGLAHEPQDWGIANADASRIDDFIIYYEENKENLNFAQAFAIGELIIASANEACIENTIDKDEAKEIAAWICKNFSLLEGLIEYWESLRGSDFPFSDFLRSNNIDY